MYNYSALERPPSLSLSSLPHTPTLRDLILQPCTELVEDLLEVPTTYKAPARASEDSAALKEVAVQDENKVRRT